MSNQHGEFIWYELLTDNADAAEAFYAELIGWSVQHSEQPDMDYRIFSALDRDSGDSNEVGGLMALDEEMKAGGARPVWLGYIAVDDVDAAVAKLCAEGGSLQMPAMDIPEVGRIAMITDPQGAPFYIMKAFDDRPSLAFAADKPRPGHCAWNELVTEDPEAAKSFYFGNFGWTKDGQMDMPEGPYEFIRHNGMIGAVMKRPEAMPVSAWLYYFRVPDIDAAVAITEQRGGQILFGPEEIPDGDLIIQALDPQGALFSLIGSRKT